MYEELYAQNVGLLRAMAKRYAPLCAMDRAVSQEDLEQAGFLGLVRAEETYDSAGGKSWASWAAWHILRALDQALCIREGCLLQAHSGADSLDRPVDAEDGERARLGDLLPDDSAPELDAGVLREELCQGVRQAVARLEDPNQRQAVRLMRLEERTPQAAAAAMGVSVTRVQRLNRQGEIRLAQDGRLRDLAELDERTRFHAHKGVAAFNADWTSVTEAAALWRIEERERLMGRGIRREGAPSQRPSPGRF